VIKGTNASMKYGMKNSPVLSTETVWQKHFVDSAWDSR